MLISVSERATAKRCERRWGLSSDNAFGLEPVVNSPALVVGGLVQLAISEWTEAPETVNLEHTYLREMTHSHDRIVSNYKAKVGASPNDSELTKVFEAMGLGQEMVNNYLEYHKTPLPPGYTAVRTEQRAIVDVPNTEHWECDECHWILSEGNVNNSIILDPEWSFDKTATNVCPRCAKTGAIQPVTWQPHRLRGTMDTFVQDSRGKLWCLERKTYDIRPTLEKLQHDDQQLAYVWIMQQLFGAKNVGGILYDGMWKRPLSKRHPTLEELFFRQPIVRPQAEVNNFGRLLPRECKLIADMAQQPLLDLTINRVWQGCWDCKFDRLCQAMSKGEDYQYVMDNYYVKRETPATDIIEDDA